MVAASELNTNTSTSSEAPDSIAQYIKSRAANPIPIPFHGVPSPVTDNAHQQPSSKDAAAYLLDQIHQHPIPSMSMMHFNSLNFDGVDFNQVPGTSGMMGETADIGDESGNDGPTMDQGDIVMDFSSSVYDDWVWNAMMQDFSMPGM